jgi:hypothetical protein
MDSVLHPDQRYCGDCGLRPASEFGSNSNGYPRCYCKKCHNKRCSARTKIRRSTPEGRSRENVKVKAHRKDPSRVAKFILHDSRHSDRKRSFENDLTLEFVKSLISTGCSYCGEVELRMTLDRVDNSVGHVQSNVVPACIRCNYTRRSMPHPAWMCLVQGMREAREKGLFGVWTGRCR